MLTRLVRIEAIAIAALVVAACSDNGRDLLAPKAPEKLVVLGPINGPVLYPRLPDPNSFVDIAASGSHTCVRKFSGDVLCWGAQGEAGYGTIVQSPTLAFSGAKQIAVGDAHACAINTSGAAYCWGGGEEGQLGIQIGAQIGSGSGWVLGPKDPNSYYGTLAPLAFTSIYASSNSTCGLASSGTYCWGVVGDYTHPGFMSIPNLVVTPGNYSYNGFLGLAIGKQHVCGLYDTGGSVGCWGADTFGQAGSDPASTIYFPNTKMVIFAMNTGLTSGVARVSAQGDFTCADMNAGTVQCFGIDDNGQLGNGVNAFSFAPVAVGNGATLHGVAAGARHACALDANNEAWCWGYNYYGQVGNGVSSYSTTGIQKVLGVSTGYQTNGAAVKFQKLAAGSLHTCGLSTDNHVYCWGNNGSRQLGVWLVGSNGQGIQYGWAPSPVFVM
jgi:alpha-tubulin suppressor-like RCC1 family protein